MGGKLSARYTGGAQLIWALFLILNTCTHNLLILGLILAILLKLQLLLDGFILQLVQAEQGDLSLKLGVSGTKVFRKIISFLIFWGIGTKRE